MNQPIEIKPNQHNQSINQTSHSINQLINQPIKSIKTINQANKNKQTNQFSESTSQIKSNQQINQSANQPISQSTNQPINESTNSKANKTKDQHNQSIKSTIPSIKSDQIIH